MLVSQPFQHRLQKTRSFLGVKRNNFVLRNLDNVTVAIDNPTIGLFAQLTWCAYIFQFAVEHQKTIRIRLVSQNYRPTPTCVDWFSHYFEGDGVSPADEGDSTFHLKIQHMEDLGLGITPSDKSIEATRTAFLAKARPGREIQDEVDSFVKENFPDTRVLGVHFRGTDKKTEAPTVRYEKVLGAVKAKITERNFETIFISTDEAAFIDYMKSKLPPQMIVFRNDTRRSTDDTPVHIGLQRGTDTARDAIVNCLLLARCQSIVRTSSYLSAWSIIFNPSLDVLTLNKPFQNALWFPEREILARYDTLVPPEQPGPKTGLNSITT